MTAKPFDWARALEIANDSSFGQAGLRAWLGAACAEADRLQTKTTRFEKVVMAVEDLNIRPSADGNVLAFAGGWIHLQRMLAHAREDL